MKRMIYIGLAVVVLIAVFRPWALSQPHDPELSRIMRQKLESAQAALEGIAMEDYAKIAQAADTLVELTGRAEWTANRDEQYLRHAREFRYRAEELRMNAQNKLLDAATLSYVRLTMACSDCHKHLRNPQIIQPLDE